MKIDMENRSKNVDLIREISPGKFGPRRCVCKFVFMNMPILIRLFVLTNMVLNAVHQYLHVLNHCLLEFSANCCC